MTRFVAILVLALTCTSSARAGIIFFINDQAGFNAATVALTFEGTEDFESSILPPNSFTQFNDPLLPGLLNSGVPVFLTGTNPATGLTVQANTLGGFPVVPSPGGSNALTTASFPFGGTPTDQVSTSQEAHSLDLLFSLASDIEAVGLVPLYFDSSFNPADLGTIEIEVFDSLNTSLGTDSIEFVDFTLPNSFLGIVANGGDDIGRINLHDGSVVQHFVGADDISVFSAATVVIPEPSSLVLWCLGVMGLSFYHWRRQSKTV